MVSEAAVERGTVRGKAAAVAAATVTAGWEVYTAETTRGAAVALYRGSVRADPSTATAVAPAKAGCEAVAAASCAGRAARA
jgi:hypothetical protein